MVHVLYNTTAGAHCGKENIEIKMKETFKGEELTLIDTVAIEDKRAYLSTLSREDKLVIVGGDGTLNNFVNATDDIDYPFPIYCYAAGTGNDFINDVAGVGLDSLVEINDYIRALPTVEVKGKRMKFINGVGFGVDGFCCEEGDKYRERTGKAPNYTAIAIKGALYAFKKVTAKITVDGVTEEYKDVWLSSAMNGRYYGGGMKIAPEQDRLNSDRELTFVVATCRSRIRLLMAFTKIFTGEHVKYPKIFKFKTGKHITVEFDKPTALQVDGETEVSVTGYTAYSSAYVPVKETETV